MPDVRDGPSPSYTSLHERRSSSKGRSSSPAAGGRRSVSPRSPSVRSDGCRPTAVKRRTEPFKLSQVFRQQPGLFDPNKISCVEKYITEIDALPEKYQHAETVYLSNNSLVNLRGIQQFRNVRALSLANNCISDYGQLNALKGASRLQNLNLEANPLAQLPYYRARVISTLPQLTMLDNKEITPAERKQADVTAKKEETMLSMLVSNECMRRKIEWAVSRVRMHTELRVAVNGKMGMLSRLDPPEYKPFDVNLFLHICDYERHIDDFERENIHNFMRMEARRAYNLQQYRTLSRQLETDPNLQIGKLKSKNTPEAWDEAYAEVMLGVQNAVAKKLSLLEEQVQEADRVHRKLALYNPRARIYEIRDADATAQVNRRQERENIIQEFRATIGQLLEDFRGDYDAQATEYQKKIEVLQRQLQYLADPLASGPLVGTSAPRGPPPPVGRPVPGNWRRSPPGAGRPPDRGPSPGRGPGGAGGSGGAPPSRIPRPSSSPGPQSGGPSLNSSMGGPSGGGGGGGPAAGCESCDEGPAGPAPQPTARHDASGRSDDEGGPSRSAPSPGKLATAAAAPAPTAPPPGSPTRARPQRPLSFSKAPSSRPASRSSAPRSAASIVDPIKMGTAYMKARIRVEEEVEYLREQLERMRAEALEREEGAQRLLEINGQLQEKLKEYKRQNEANVHAFEAELDALSAEVSRAGELQAQRDALAMQVDEAARERERLQEALEAARAEAAKVASESEYARRKAEHYHEELRMLDERSRSEEIAEHFWAESTARRFLRRLREGAAVQRERRRLKRAAAIEGRRQMLKRAFGRWAAAARLAARCRRARVRRTEECVATAFIAWHEHTALRRIAADFAGSRGKMRAWTAWRLYTASAGRRAERAQEVAEAFSERSALARSFRAWVRFLGLQQRLHAARHEASALYERRLLARSMDAWRAGVAIQHQDRRAGRHHEHDAERKAWVRWQAFVVHAKHFIHNGIRADALNHAMARRRAATAFRAWRARCRARRATDRALASICARRLSYAKQAVLHEWREALVERLREQRAALTREKEDQRVRAEALEARLINSDLEQVRLYERVHALNADLSRAQQAQGDTKKQIEALGQSLEESAMVEHALRGELERREARERELRDEVARLSQSTNARQDEATAQAVHSLLERQSAEQALLQLRTMLEEQRGEAERADRRAREERSRLEAALAERQEKLMASFEIAGELRRLLDIKDAAEARLTREKAEQEAALIELQRKVTLANAALMQTIELRDLRIRELQAQVLDAQSEAGRVRAERGRLEDESLEKEASLRKLQYQVQLMEESRRSDGPGRGSGQATPPGGDPAAPPPSSYLVELSAGSVSSPGGPRGSSSGSSRPPTAAAAASGEAGASPRPKRRTAREGGAAVRSALRQPTPLGALSPGLSSVTPASEVGEGPTSARAGAVEADIERLRDDIRRRLEGTQASSVSPAPAPAAAAPLPATTPPHLRPNPSSRSPSPHKRSRSPGTDRDDGPANGLMLTPRSRDLLRRIEAVQQQLGMAPAVMAM